MGLFLIEEHPAADKQVCFILSGNASDRGNKAIALYNKNLATHFFCSGQNISNDLKSIGIQKKECEVQKEFLIRNGIADSLITLLAEGTSTYEEIAAIENYCRRNHIKNATILSSKFHTRRINLILHQQKCEVHYSIDGANSSLFKEGEWWKSEYGLIALNNEYIKWLYYIWKY